ncbi:hypothetical protein [Candidatus Bathycorpusculum sp.]
MSEQQEITPKADARVNFGAATVFVRNRNSAELSHRYLSKNT